MFELQSMQLYHRLVILLQLGLTTSSITICLKFQLFLSHSPIFCILLHLCLYIVRHSFSLKFSLLLLYLILIILLISYHFVMVPIAFCLHHLVMIRNNFCQLYLVMKSMLRIKSNVMLRLVSYLSSKYCQFLESISHFNRYFIPVP